MRCYARTDPPPPRCNEDTKKKSRPALGNPQGKRRKRSAGLPFFSRGRRKRGGEGHDSLYLEKCHPWWIVGMSKKNANRVPRRNANPLDNPPSPSVSLGSQGGTILSADFTETRERGWRSEDDTILIKSCQFISTPTTPPLHKRHPSGDPAFVSRWKEGREGDEKTRDTSRDDNKKFSPARGN